MLFPLGSRGRRELADINLHSGSKCLVCSTYKLARDFFVDVSLAAVVADLGGNALNYKRHTAALERHCCFAGPGFAVLADHTHHWTFLLLNPGCQRSGSGSYTVTTIVALSAKLSAATTCTGLLPGHPSTRRLG